MNLVHVIKGAAIGREPENGPQYGEILSDGSLYTLTTNEVHAVACPPQFRSDDVNIVQATCDISPTLSASGRGTERAGESRGQDCVVAHIAHSLRGEGFDASEDGTGRGTPIVPVAFSERSRDGATAIEFEKTGITAAIKTGTQRQQGVLGSFGVRRLMPIECEKCQGMPCHWTRYGIDDKGREVELSDSARYRLIGNSVAVPVVEWIGKRIMDS